jgi:rubrerythrin
VGRDTEREILAILEEAIRREQSAHKLYSRGEALADKEELREVFAMLAREELGHERLLRGIYYEHKKRLGMLLLHPDKEHGADDATD